MTTINEYFEQALLSSAAYADLQSGMSPDVYKAALEASGRISTVQAEQFISKYTVVDQYTEPVSGFSGTVFQDASGQQYLAIRGTEPSSILGFLADGSNAVDGFDALRQEDSNGDGVVNSQDANWDNLRVWQDANQDGISQSSELSSLDSLGITGINTGSTVNSQVLPNGNQIADLGTFTYADGTTSNTGSTGGMADINLAVDTFHRTFADTIPATAEAALLPDMQGSGMRRFALFLGVTLLLAANTACAASFDCDKAGTKVEKMICADPELSKLDEELGDVYAKARDASSSPDELKRKQRDWIKERNECSDSQCLSQVYKERIEVLEQAATDMSSEHRYPPYPSIWYRKIPVIEAGSIQHDFFLMPDGDYYVVYATSYSPIDKKLEFGGIRFFDGKESEHVDKYGLLGKLDYKGKGELSVNLPSGIKISLKNLDKRMPKRCPQMLNYYYSIEHPDGRIEKKSLLYLLDKPKLININKRCSDTQETSFKEGIVSLQGGFVPLEDHGVLFTEPFVGLVIRFDDDFRTKSNLLGKRLFIVNTDELQAIGLGKFENSNYQRIQNKILELIKHR